MTPSCRAFDGFGAGAYPVIYADPPWDYNNRVQHGGKDVGYTSGAQAFYSTMRPNELKALPIQRLSPAKAILFLWTTGPQLEVSIDVGRAWGFDYRTVAFVWDKRRVNPGYYTMSQCEFVLAMVRGGIPKPRGARNVRQMLSEARTVHSRKPGEVRSRIDQMFPDLKKIELFARDRCDGWDAWGDELSLGGVDDNERIVSSENSVDAEQPVSSITCVERG